MLATRPSTDRRDKLLRARRAWSMPMECKFPARAGHCLKPMNERLFDVERDGAGNDVGQKRDAAL